MAQSLFLSFLPPTNLLGSTKCALSHWVCRIKYSHSHYIGSETKPHGLPCCPKLCGFPCPQASKNRQSFPHDICFLQRGSHSIKACASVSQSQADRQRTALLHYRKDTCIALPNHRPSLMYCESILLVLYVSKSKAIYICHYHYCS